MLANGTNRRCVHARGEKGCENYRVAAYMPHAYTHACIATLEQAGVGLMLGREKGVVACIHKLNQ